MMCMTRRVAAVAIVVVIAGTAGDRLEGQRASAPVPAQAPTIGIESLAGVDSFSLYCAACHGDSGEGDGPVASALRTPPPDLTTLARRSGGAFPGVAVRDTIMGSGRALAAHGTTEMPVWGPMFRAFEGDARAQERVGNLVAHLESIQVPTTAPGDAGSRLFRTYCASCHGTDARGNGPMAEQLRRVPPDLTQYTRRNGGVFPSKRVYRIVEGRDVPSHGDREMPVWGDVFRMVPSPRAAGGVGAQIDAVVRYLESIQERGA